MSYVPMCQFVAKGPRKFEIGAPQGAVDTYASQRGHMLGLQSLQTSRYSDLDFQSRQERVYRARSCLSHFPLHCIAPLRSRHAKHGMDNTTTVTAPSADLLRCSLCALDTRDRQEWRDPALQGQARPFDSIEAEFSCSTLAVLAFTMLGQDAHIICEAATRQCCMYVLLGVRLKRRWICANAIT